MSRQYIFTFFLLIITLNYNESTETDQCHLSDTCYSTAEDIYETGEKMPKRLTLVGYKAYMENVAQQFINGIEQYGLGNFQFDNFETKIDSNLFGIEIVGNASFTNGFLDKIQEANIYTQPGVQYDLDEKTNVARISVPINLVNPSYIFEFEAKRPSPKPKLYGSVEITDQKVDMQLVSFKSFTNKTIWGQINIQSVGPQNPWDFDPPTNETELIRRESTRKYFFMDNWNKFAKSILLDILNMIIAKMEYPSICYDCPLIIE